MLSSMPATEKPSVSEPSKSKYLISLIIIYGQLAVSSVFLHTRPLKVT